MRVQRGSPLPQSEGTRSHTGKPAVYGVVQYCLFRRAVWERKKGTFHQQIPRQEYMMCVEGTTVSNTQGDEWEVRFSRQDIGIYTKRNKNTSDFISRPKTGKHFFKQRPQNTSVDVQNMIQSQNSAISKMSKNTDYGGKTVMETETRWCFRLTVTNHTHTQAQSRKVSVKFCMADTQGKPLDKNWRQTINR